MEAAILWKAENIFRWMWVNKQWHSHYIKHFTAWKAYKCLIIILAVINLVNVRQLKMSQENESRVPRSWEGGRKSADLSEIRMLHASLPIGNEDPN